MPYRFVCAAVVLLLAVSLAEGQEVSAGSIIDPAAVRWPAGLKGGRTTTQVMTVLDVLPTLAAAAGIPSGNTKPLDGKNLWPNIVGGDVQPREDLFFAVGTGNPTRLAVRRGEWKLVREVYDSGQARNYLFHIEQDPNETSDVSATHPALVKDLIGAIDKWRALYLSSARECSPVPPPGWTVPKDWALAAAQR